MFLNKLLQVVQIILKISGLLLFFGSIIVFILLNLNWRFFYWYNDAQIPSNLITPTVTLNKPTPTPVVINTTVKSLKDETVQVIQPPVSTNQFINYFDRVNYLLNGNWNGEADEVIRINLDNFSTDNLNLYKDWLLYKSDQRKIPDNLSSLYLTSTAKQEFIDVAITAQSDYIKYLTAVGVDSQYIREIQNNTLPTSIERISIFLNSSGKDDSDVDFIKDGKGDVVNSDYSRYMLKIYSNDVYYYAQQFKNSNIVNASKLTSGENIDKVTRDMAIRFVTFKGMTSALQRAVETVNSPDKYKTDKDSYLKSIKSLANITNSYELNWGGLIYNQSNNRNIVLKRQQNYIALEVVSTVYDLSANQKQNIFIKLYGKDANNGGLLRSLITNFNNSYSKYPLENLRAKLLSDFISKIDSKNIYRQVLLEVNSEFGNIDDYVADYSYLTNDEILALWQYLK